MGKKQSGRGKHIHVFLAFIAVSVIVICGCAHMYEGLVASPDFNKADEYAKKGNYGASIREYEKIVTRYPRVGDRALFEMGIIYASAKNPHRNFERSLECFDKLVKNYPKSKYRQDSDTLIYLLSEITNRDRAIASQKRQIDELGRQVDAVEKKMEQMKEVDMTLKQRKKTHQR